MLRLSPFITVYCCAVAALLGACTGSFLACLAWRTIHEESVLRGRSHCDVCGHVLGVRDLVPVFSYLLSGGKCRYCGAKLSARHVWGELISAAVFVSLLLQYDISLQTLEGWLLACVLLACAFADLEGYIIPDRFLLFGAGVFIVFLMWEPEPLHRLIQGALGGLAVPGALLPVVLIEPEPLRRGLDGLIGGVTVSGGLLLLSLYMDKRMQRETLGGGDIKLLFLTGLFFGWKGNLLCLVLACVAGIVWGLAGKRRGEAIPWGPSIAIGAWITALAGQPFINWYLGLFA